MKDELGVRIITKFVGLKTRIRIYLMDEGSEDKKGKNTKNSLATNPWSSIQNINNWRLWISKNKFIIFSNKSATRY